MTKVISFIYAGRMLHTPATFPHPGAQAFLVGDAQLVRIIQRRADGMVTVAVEEQYKRASSTRTVALSDLAASAEAALEPLRSQPKPRAPRRRKARA